MRVRLGRIPGASAREAARGVLPPRGHRLVLNLFDDVVVRARLARTERQGKALVWAGKIDGQPVGDVVLAVVDGVLSGSAVWPGGAYRIRFDGTSQIVEELDHDRFPEDGCFREVPGGVADVAAAPAASPAASPDDGSLDRRARRLHAGGPRRGRRDVRACCPRSTSRSPRRTPATRTATSSSGCAWRPRSR